ncbi:MAG: hypothetical protein ACSHX7_03695 [Luteolibacter sp.]
MKFQPSLLFALFVGITPIQSFAQEAVVPTAEPVALADVTTEETSALIAAINKLRTDSGLEALVVDTALSARAAIAFPGVLNSPAVVDVTAIRKDFKASDAAILRGVVTYRKPASGGEFPKYWAEDPQWNEVMLGDFTHIGAATVKRSDGKLVAYAYLIKK